MQADRARALAAGSEAAVEARLGRQTRLVFIITTLTVLGALGVGWLAHDQSRDVLIEGFLLRNLVRARAQAARLELAGSTGPLRADDEYPRAVERAPRTALAPEELTQFAGRYKQSPGALAGEYMCVVGADGRLALHTATPEKIGLEVGSGPFRGESRGEHLSDAADSPANLLELIAGGSDWVGHYRALDGTRQLAAFAYAPRTNALVAIHVPWASVEGELRRVSLPWAIGFALLALVLLPASLVMLHRAYMTTANSWRNAQVALRESEARLHAAVESLPFDFWMLDGEGRCVLQNAASKRAHGDHIGERTEDMPLPGAVKEHWSANNARAYAGEVIVDDHDEVVLTGPRSCRSVIMPVREGGRTIGILGVNIDVTEQQRAVEAQRGLAERLRILREIDRAVLATVSLEEIVSRALGELQRLHPCHRMSVVLAEGGEGQIFAVVGKSGDVVLPGLRLPIGDMGYGSLEDMLAGAPHEVDDIDAFLAARRSPVLEALRAEGMRAFLNMPLISQGELFGTLNIGLDRPGRVPAELREIATEVADMLAVAIREARLDAQLARQATELEHRVAERTRELSAANAELEGYIHSVSHDLRAPLRAIHSFGDALSENLVGKLDLESQTYLERMVAAAGRMDRLLLDLLDYSRLGRSDLDLKPVDVAAVTAEARALLGGELERRHAILAVEEPLLPLVAHEPLLVQAVANLLSNAAKFVAPGVRPVIHVRTERRDAFVRLSVRDNGIGIAPDDQTKIFHVFERLHRVETFPGTGIGLAIVRRAIERMGGRVGVDSVPSEGSTFWIELPGTEMP